jgi:NADH dehydrogenase
MLSPVYIDDVVSAIAKSIFIKEIEGKTIMLTGPEELTYDDLVDRIAAYFNVKRFKLHLPAGLVKLTATVMSNLGVNILVPDQIPRLLSEKNYNIDVARQVLNYSPCYLEDGMKKVLYKK